MVVSFSSSLGGLKLYNECDVEYDKSRLDGRKFRASSFASRNGNLHLLFQNLINSETLDRLDIDAVMISYSMCVYESVCLCVCVPVFVSLLGLPWFVLSKPTLHRP